MLVTNRRVARTSVWFLGVRLIGGGLSPVWSYYEQL
jgi:hypothetical protein